VPSLAEGDFALSDRERQILSCLIHGQSNKVIARELDIAEATVKVHVKGLLRKLRAANRTQAAVWALKHRSALNGTEVLAAD
jgi:two-component system nitrate/nitrite response regulator NarL